MAAKKISKNITFEDALALLEQQVEQLEGGKLSLEESLEAFKMGVELSKICHSRLNTVKQEVAKIIPQEGSLEYSLENFQDMEA